MMQIARWIAVLVLHLTGHAIAAASLDNNATPIARAPGIDQMFTVEDYLKSLDPAVLAEVREILGTLPDAKFPPPVDGRVFYTLVVPGKIGVFSTAYELPDVSAAMDYFKGSMMSLEKNPKAHRIPVAARFGTADEVALAILDGDDGAAVGNLVFIRKGTRCISISMAGLVPLTTSEEIESLIADKLQRMLTTELQARPRSSQTDVQTESSTGVPHMLCLIGYFAGRFLAWLINGVARRRMLAPRLCGWLGLVAAVVFQIGLAVWAVQNPQLQARIAQLSPEARGALDAQLYATPIIVGLIMAGLVALAHGLSSLLKSRRRVP